MALRSRYKAKFTPAGRYGFSKLTVESSVGPFTLSISGNKATATADPNGETECTRNVAIDPFKNLRVFFDFPGQRRAEIVFPPATLRQSRASEKFA